MPETLYLIDGYAQIFRAFYAIRTEMHSPNTGEPTNAVFGFTAMLLKLLRQFQPHYVAVAIDAPGKTFRDDLYLGYHEIRYGATLPEIALSPEAAALIDPVTPSPDIQPALYKGTRNATPDSLTAQVPRIFEVIDAFGIPILGQPGLEADDVIATLTQRILDDAACNDLQIRIITKDKDLEQLIGDRVTLFDVHTDTVLDAAALKAGKGITPDQVIDLLALTGDSVDNIPGIEGIGLKTAAQLLQQYGSIEGILAHLDEIKGKRRENLERGRVLLPLSRDLVTLKRDGDFPFALHTARIRPPNLERLIPLFQELGFNRFQDEVRRLT